MARLEILPFADEYLEGAPLLLAGRHARHRATEPLLPEIADFREHAEREWLTAGASGAVALENGATVGYLIGKPKKGASGGTRFPPRYPSPR